MKKVLCMILALVLVFALGACGGGTPASAPPAAPSTAASTTAESTPAAAAPAESAAAAPAPAESAAAAPAPAGGYNGGSFNLKIGTYFSGMQGGGEYAQKFADRVAELSDGKIVIDVYQDSQLGSQSELCEAISLGTIDFCPQDWAMFDTVLGYKKGAIVGFPFVFKDWDNVYDFYQSDAFAQMKQELLDNYGIRSLGSAADGFRKMYTQTPVNNIEDLKSVKLRVPDISVYIETFSALGATTVIVPGAELYTSLQNGIVNAMERPADGMYSNNLYEQTKYVVTTDHIFVDVGLFVSETVFQKLDADAQAVIMQAGEEVSDEHFEYMRTKDLEALDALVTECNQELIEFDTTEMQQIVMDEVWPKYLSEIDGGQDVVDAIQSLAK